MVREGLTLSERRQETLAGATQVLGMHGSHDSTAQATSSGFDNWELAKPTQRRSPCRLPQADCLLVALPEAALADPPVVLVTLGSLAMTTREINS